MSIQTLQTYFANATWPITLDAAFLAAGGVTPPAGFDALLNTSFLLNGATGLSVGQGAVGAVSGNQFSVTGATLTNGLFGATAADTSVTLTFSLPDGDNAVLLVQIATALGAGWNFATGFPAMVGDPFSQLSFAQASMLFSTAAGQTSWPAGSASTVDLTPGMTFAGVLALNAYAQSVLTIANLTGAAIPSPLVMAGPFDASGISDTAIYPVMSLAAPLTANTFTFLGFTAANPHFGLDIGALPTADTTSDDPPQQLVSYVFGATLTTATSPSLELDFAVALFAGSNGYYAMTLAPPPDDPTPLTPAAIATIAGVPSSFIAFVPSQLQSFFTSIAFQTLNVTAMWPAGAAAPTISSTGVSVGTVSNFNYVLIDDPTGTFEASITSLDLNWQVLNPATPNPRQLLQFTATFIALPTVFTNADGSPGGLFTVTINQDFAISATFDGQVSLANLLPAVTGGLVHMPSGISVIFSDVQLLIDPGNYTYSFSFVVDLSVDIISFNGQPLIQLQGMTLALSAQTPQTAGASTTYSASMSGLLVVASVGLNVDIAYDGTASPPQWNFQSSLASPLNLGTLLTELFAVVDLNTFLPDFLPSSLVVQTFSVAATIPTGTAPSKYSISGSLIWTTDALAGLPITCTADLALAYDGSQTANPYSGSVLGTIDVASIQGLNISIAYAFNQPGSPGGMTLTVQWEGVTGTYNSTNQTITLTLSGWSLGSLVTSLVGLTGNPYFSLSGPWTFLNSISLDGLSLTFYMAANAPTTVSVTYTLSSPITTGFLNIDGFTFNRDPKTGKILFSISGSSPLSSSSPEWQALFSSPDSNTATGQDVTNMPSVPGQGNSLFDLQLLALGQHVSINAANMDSTQDVIQSLAKIPATTSGGSNPVSPGSTTAGQPYYNAASNWLIALNIGLLGVKTGDSYTYTISLMVVFNDPDLYGLRLALTGSKAGPLAGLSFDIMYKKVTATVGVYQLTLVLPTSIRQWNFGAVNVTLPAFGIEIYTNGDFLFDVGFPYNMDFSQSCTVQMIVPPGIPLMGSGGFYYGQLSNATATNLPVTTLGTFDPVIEFGLGLQAGLGYSIDKGILSAGFSITFFGIIQGVIAPWHPYQGATDDTTVQSGNYFWLEGQFGIQGKLYGTVNFAIISASVSVSIVISAQIVYEAYGDIALSVAASVSVSVSVKIDLGIFSFSISFSFATTISEDFTIQAPAGQGTAPWYATPSLSSAGRAALQSTPMARSKGGRVRRFRGKQPTVPLMFAPLRANSIANAAAADTTLPVLTIVFTPQFTVLAPDVTQLSLAGQQGAFVALFSMDAPAASGNPGGSSFAALCAALLPWVIASHPETASANLGATAMDSTPVSVDTLNQILATLACPADQPALATSDILSFLQTSFTVDIVTTPSSTQQTNLQAGAVIFPAIPGLQLTVPSPTQAGATVTIDFQSQAQITPAYRTGVIATFNEVAATLANPANPAPAPVPPCGSGAPPSDAPESLARVLFEDSFNMICRQLIQAAIDSYASYPYTLQPNDSLQTIMNFAQGATTANPDFTFQDLVNANSTVSLTGGNVLQFPGILYTVQSNDSLNAIAAKFTTTPAALIETNATATALLQAGVTITVGLATTATQPGSSFASVAQALGIDVPTLAAQTSLYGMTNLLLPAASMMIPAIAYTTNANGTDTIGALLSQFGLSTDAFVAVPSNLTVANFFNAQKESLVYLANLEMLTGSQLAQAISGATIGNTAGMVSRFMLQGLRLPNSTGLTLPSDFLYPVNQPQYGLYQLTGQQFPVTTYGSTWTVTLAKNQTTLSWVEINGSAGTSSGQTDLTGAAANLQVVLNWAVAYGYNPSAPTIDPGLTLAVQPALTLVPQQFGASGFTPWSTSGMADIASLTGGGQSQPILWQLPSALLSQVETQQGALTQDMSLATALPYLPALTPWTLTTDPTTSTATLADVANFTFATRIDFTIRQLQQSAGAQTPTATSNTLLPSGAGNTPPVTEMAPNAYQLIGPSPSDAQLLQRILNLINAAGTGIITGVLAGYGNPSTGTGGLTGHAASDVYSFVTRTNLSTQGNPPPAALVTALGAGVPTVVNDFVNQPKDFIQLLWELATVQSGGYSFYWDGLVDGASLPSGLFDANGFATVTLLVTYDPPAGSGAGVTMTDCFNAVLTSSYIDTTRSTLVLVSQSEPNTAVTLATDSIASFAARYGMTPGTLAAANGQAPLQTGARFALGSVTHQVTPADLASGNVWATVAAYYSITAQALQAYNPGVTASLYTVLLIPAIAYVVAKGDTLSGIAGYFGLSVEQVGSMAQAVTGLIPTGQTLAVNSQSFSVSPVLGIGNAGMQLSRANPPQPGGSNDPNYGQDYMFSLYSLLDMGWYGNQFFAGSAPGLPFGPTAPADAPAGNVPASNDEGELVGSSKASARQLRSRRAMNALRAANKHSSAVAAIRDPESRQAMLAAQAALPAVSYEQALCFSGYASTNAAPANPPANLPPASANPYAGVGSVGQFGLRWLDLFGNQTVTPFDDPPTGYTGPLNNAPAPILYTDMLLALSQWPNVTASYAYTGAAGAPQLTIALALNTAAYQPTGGVPAPAALTDSAAFNSLYFQLNQNYDGLGIPGVTGSAVTFSLANSLTGDTPQPLDSVTTAQLISFVNSCAQTVNAAALKNPVAPPSSLATTLTIPITLAGIVSNNVVRLQLWLVQSRQPVLVDPSLLDVQGGVSVETEILAAATTSDKSSDALMPFAQSMEAAFVTSQWQYRVGVGPADPDEALANQTYTVWAVRFSLNNSGQGIGFTLGSVPAFYAPQPVANSLYAGTVNLPVYTTGKPLGSGPATTFTGVDLNVWMAQALALIDTFLSPTYGVPTFILDTLNGNDPDSAGFLFEILNLKSQLATAIAGTVLPILNGPAQSATTASAAEEVLNQSLLQKLANASAVTAVVVVPVTNATTNEAQAPGIASPPALYGLPVNSALPSGTLPPNYSLSAASLPLNAAGAASKDSALAFLFTCSNPSLQTSISLPLTYQITQLQNDITAVQGIDGYRQSTWIAFVTGPFSYPVGSSAIDFPVPLLSLPLPPTAQGQSADGSTQSNPTPAQLPDWDYTFTYLANGAAQDSLSVAVGFNTPASQAPQANDPTAGLFTALAGVISCTPAIFADFNTYLVPIGPQTPKANTSDANAAVTAWLQLITTLTTAYQQWATGTVQPALAAELQSGPPPVSLNFSVELVEGEDDSAVVYVLQQGGASQPVPTIGIADYTVETYQPTDPPPSLWVAYRYLNTATDKYLPYSQALPLAQTVEFDGLSAIQYQSADTSIEIQRNLVLVQGQTVNDAFVFTTQPVTSATPAVPLVIVAAYDLTTLEPPAPPPLNLQSYLGEFFNQLLGASGAGWVSAQIGASARYPLVAVAGSPLIDVPVLLMPPSAPTTNAIDDVAAAVTNWLTAKRQSLSGVNATLNFEVILYSTAPGAAMPLVKIEDVFVPVDSIK